MKTSRKRFMRGILVMLAIAWLWIWFMVWAMTQMIQKI